jgi:hypothetical protein
MTEHLALAQKIVGQIPCAADCRDLFGRLLPLQKLAGCQLPPPPASWVHSCSIDLMLLARVGGSLLQTIA